MDGVCFMFFKQKTAYEMRMSDWSSDVCSSVLRLVELRGRQPQVARLCQIPGTLQQVDAGLRFLGRLRRLVEIGGGARRGFPVLAAGHRRAHGVGDLRGSIGLAQRLHRQGAEGRGLLGGSQPLRSEEHTSELQSLMRISYADFCLKKKK